MNAIAELADWHLLPAHNDGRRVDDGTALALYERAYWELQQGDDALDAVVVAEHQRLDDLRHRRDAVQQRRGVDRGSIDPTHQQGQRPDRADLSELTEP